MKWQRLSSKYKIDNNLTVVCKNRIHFLHNPIMCVHLITIFQIDVVHVRLCYKSVKIRFQPDHLLCSMIRNYKYVGLKILLIVRESLELGIRNSLIVNGLGFTTIKGKINSGCHEQLSVNFESVYYMKF